MNDNKNDIQTAKERNTKDAEATYACSTINQTCQSWTVLTDIHKAKLLTHKASCIIIEVHCPRQNYKHSD